VDSVPIDITSSNTMESFQKLISDACRRVCTLRGYVHSKGVYAQEVCTFKRCVHSKRLYAWKVCTLEGCVRSEGMYPCRGWTTAGGAHHGKHPEVERGRHPEVVRGRHPEVVRGRQPEVVRGRHPKMERPLLTSASKIIRWLAAPPDGHVI